MPCYTFNNTNIGGGSQQNLSSSFKTLVSANAATGATTLRRGWITELNYGAADVPNATDCPINWDASVMTAAGTGTAGTPQVNDVGGADAAALLTYTYNYTAEPTVTANSSLWTHALNQRASYRTQFRDKFSALIVPAVNLKGIVLRAKSPNYASIATISGLIEE